MRLIVGLGNPGKDYEKTRHNVGFLVLDKLALKKDFLPWRLEGRFNAQITQTGNGEERIIFAKPQTFMNLSGEAVGKIMSYYHIPSDDLLVIQDDIDLPFGSIRVRKEGSSGGHNGIKSIISQLGDDRFWRIKIGVGRSENSKVSPTDYVLSKFSKTDFEKLDKILDQTGDLVLKYPKEDLEERTIKIQSTKSEIRNNIK